MQVSSRHSLAAAVLVALCAIPVWFHALQEPVRDECNDPNAFFLAKRVGTAVASSNPWRFEAGDAKGRIRLPSGRAVRVRVFRVRDAWKLYGSPMSFGYDSMAYLVPRERRTIEAGAQTLPVHWSRFEMDGLAHLEAWTFAYGNRPVSHPLAAWAGLAWKQLFEGAQPLTVMIAAAEGPPDEIERLEETVAQWFPAAWEQLRAACDS